MCLDGTRCRQGSLDAPDATRCGAQGQDAQGAQDVEFESGRNTMVSDTNHLFSDVIVENKGLSSIYSKPCI